MLPILIALSTLVSEDLTCIATGVLIAQHRVHPAAGLLACTLGIFAGDLLLVAAGRYATLLRIKRPSCLDLLNHRATSVLMWTRFAPGLRLPTYVGAGMLRLPMRVVVPPLLAGAVLWTPLLVGLTALFGAAFVTNGLRAFQFFVIAAAAWYILSSYERRRRAQAFFHRLFRWEFWPAWTAYLPVIPYLLWLGLKHRSPTLFALANPGIPGGGLAGESKSDILRHLSREPDFVARFALIAASESVYMRRARVQAFMRDTGLSFPIVLKPDVGERGTGVAIVRSLAEVHTYLQQSAHNVIAQEYIAGEEFGVFYCRRPSEPAGWITSIAWKRLPSVMGDGRRTLNRLILSDPRAFCLHGAYLRGLKRPASDVPAEGECVPLVEIGSHCRGAIFLNAAHLKTPMLEAAIDRISRAHPGFYFGRFDVRTDSIEAFQAGRFKVLELNGVGGEAAHIYDPSVTVWSAYRTIFSQWRTAFEIGAANRAAGAVPVSIGTLKNLVRGRHRECASTGRHDVRINAIT